MWPMTSRQCGNVATRSTKSHDPKSGLGLDPTAHMRPLTTEIAAPRIDSYRFSMANLEDSQDVDLDAILGELCALETVCDQEIGQAREKRFSDVQKLSHHDSRTHSRSSSEASRGLSDDSMSSLKIEAGRTESPDNDSAFSDTVSMLSSESSASSGASGAKPQTLRLPTHQDDASRIKAEKIRMAMEKIKEANIQKLFVKVFTSDGSAKSLLVDEKMLCSYVTRLLADKNHVKMDPKWAIVEHLPDLYMERFYEDHELLVDNLLLWTRESKNKIYFAERPDKIRLFTRPEQFLLANSAPTTDYDEHSRNMLLEDFFSSTNGSLPEVEGPLYLKADSKKGWKKYHFVLRASGLYYFPKEKIKSAKDLVCLATFENNHIYYGVGWRKKYKAPTDWCFAIKHPRLQEPKSTKFIKYLCADDQSTLAQWMVGMRVAKFGKQLMYNYRSLMDELAQEEMDILANARSCSVQSIAGQSSSTTPTRGYSGSEAGYGTASGSDIYTTSDVSTASSRRSRGSSSSSSGCLSDGASSCENAFDCEFSMGTIKRKPSMKPNLPLTNMTRQLKEVGETREEGGALPSPTASYTNSGTLTRRHSRRKSSNNDDSSNSGTLKRQYKSRGSVESMGGRSGGSTPLGGTTPVRERPPSRQSLLSAGASMTESITSLPPPPEPHGDVISDSASYQLPPPPPELYHSTMSLDSLPPPPNPGELPPLTGGDLTGSQLSLMSLPPPPDEEKPPERGVSPDRTPTQSRLNTPTATPPTSPNQSGQNHDRHHHAPPLTPPPYVNPPHYSLPSFARRGGDILRSSIRQPPTLPRPPAASPEKKKISFSLPTEVPPLPRKPPPPKRADSTKLSGSPKKLAEPPRDFLRDLQRVMRKKWQVAQKCKLEPETTPHEVLGFRDPPPPLPDYKEHNVSNWVQEHYGPNNLYENVYREEGGAVPVPSRGQKRPPPPPPKRSDSTHLTTPKGCH